MRARTTKHIKLNFDGGKRALRAVVLAVFFFVSLLGVNIVQILSLLMFPFSRKHFRRINRNVAALWWSWGVSASESFVRVETQITGASLPLGENAILIANHQSAVDIVVLMSLAKKNQSLTSLKWFVKDVLKYLPGVGWGMLFLDCVFVKRNWEKDATKIQSVFSTITKNKVPIWLISFSEGTRITEEKVKRSQEISRLNGLPLFQNVLLPRTKGFAAAVKGLSEHVMAVYDITIVYPEGIPTMSQFFLGLVPRITVHVDRFPIETLPVEQEQLSHWLMTRFQMKEQRLQLEI